MALRSILPFRIGAVFAAALLATACGGGGSDSSSQSNANPLAVDAGFGAGGSVRIALAPYNGAVNSIVEQPDGKLLVAGYRMLGPSVVPEYPYGVRAKSTVFVSRYLDSGQLDAGFGNGGTVEFSLRGADMYPYATVQTDGSVYVSVNASRPCHYIPAGGPRLACVINDVREIAETAWVKLSAAGVLNAGPAGDGLDATQLPNDIRALGNQATGQRLSLADGKYLVLNANTNAVGRIFNWRLSRYFADGSADTGFGTNGVVYSRCQTDQGRVLVDKQNNIWVVAAVSSTYSPPSADSGLCTEKLSESGQPSPSAPSPIKTALGTNVGVHDAKLVDDGTLMVAVHSHTDQAKSLKALKFQADGSLVESYGVRGITDLQGLSSDQMAGVSLRILDGSGAIAGTAMGQRFSDSGYDRPNLWAQWNANGALNKRFGNDGLLTMGDLPDHSSRAVVLVDSRKRWLMQTSTSASAHRDSEGVVTLTRLAGDSH